MRFLRFLWLLIVVHGLAGCALAGLGGGVAPLPSTIPQAPAIGSLAPSTDLAGDNFVTPDGAALPLRRWLPTGEPRAVVLALHGFNDYSNAFALPAPALAARGIALYAYDQRGFGAAPERGLWPGAEALESDAAQAARLLRRQYPGRPLYLLGESMGGAVAILTTTGNDPPPVDGVVLVAPAVWGRQTMNVFERAALWLARLVPAMHVSGRALPVTLWPSDNMAMLRAYNADPMVIKETRTDALNGLVDLMGAALEAAPRLRATTLILYGEHDQIVPKEPVERLVAGLPGSPHQRFAVYPSGFHMLLRDLHADLVVADIAAWLGDPGAPLPSGDERPVRAVVARNGALPSLQ